MTTYFGSQFKDATSDTPIKKEIKKSKRVKVGIPKLVEQWLRSNFQAADASSVIKKTTLFAEYHSFCLLNNIEPKHCNIFGRIVSQVFPNVCTRRLGPKGNQVCHYSGIRPRKVIASPCDNSPSNFQRLEFCQMPAKSSSDAFSQSSSISFLESSSSTSFDLDQWIKSLLDPDDAEESLVINPFATTISTFQQQQEEDIIQLVTEDMHYYPNYDYSADVRLSHY